MTLSRRSFLRMRNVSNKSCREDQNTHFMVNNVFLKIVPFLIQIRKIWWSQRGRRKQYWGGGAFHAGLVRLHARKHKPHTPPCPLHTKRTCTQKYVRLYVILIAFPRQQWFRERASTLHHSYLGCLVDNIYVRIFCLPSAWQNTLCWIYAYINLEFFRTQYCGEYLDLNGKK
jgi:hypothetical protein